MILTTPAALVAGVFVWGLYRGRNRPLLHDVDPLTKLTELMVIRAPLYESLADFTIATDGRKVHMVADAILAAFKAAQG